MLNILYSGAVADFSGYGQAGRDYVLALNQHPLVNNIHIDLRSFEHRADPSCFQDVASPENADILSSLATQKRLNKYDVHIIHMTPDLWPRVKHNASCRIGYCAWETDRIPSFWRAGLESVNQVWVPCFYNQKAVSNVCITAPAYVIPHCFDLEEKRLQLASVPTLNLTGASPSTTIFYSIGQWIERKNFGELIRAYCATFSSGEDVLLALKTFIGRGQSNETEILKEAIGIIKKKLRLPDTPPILLINKKLSNQEIIGLHKTADIYISLHRAEGWGLPVSDAILYGNEVIVSNYGGVSDFCNSENANLVSCIETFVYGMEFSVNYNGRMIWGQPNLVEASKMMRRAYLAKQNHQPLGGHQSTMEKFSYTNVSNKMIALMEEVLNGKA